MNRFVGPCCILALIGGLCHAQAQNFITNSVSVGEDIPDANLTGFTSSQNLTFAPGSTVSGIQVTLNLSGGYNGDLYAYLYHDGQYAVLLNRVGRTVGNPAGQSGAGMDVTLNDSGTDIHTASGSDTLSGTWAPDGRTTFPSMTLDTDPRSATPLGSAFDGTDASGTWTLFLADVDFGSTSTLVSWDVDLQLTSVPEPSMLALLSLGAVIFGGVVLFRRWRKA